MGNQPVPLGFDNATIDSFIAPDGKSGSERSKTLAALMVGGYIIRADENGTPTRKDAVTPNDGEYTIRQLENTAANGTIMDPFVMLSGITQTPRYKNGVDTSAALAKKIAVTALQSPGKTEIKICNRADNRCIIDKPISLAETGAVISTADPLTPEMNDKRWIAADRGLVAEAAYATTIRDPKTFAFGTYTPAEFLELKRQEAGVATTRELVSGTRALLRECITNATPSLDVKTCATVGSRAAAYYVAQHPGFQFVEQHAANLVPMPRAPQTAGNSRTAGN